MTKYMDARYDEVARLQAAAWRKVEEENLSNVETTAEWKMARQLVDTINADETAVNG